MQHDTSLRKPILRGDDVDGRVTWPSGPPWPLNTCESLFAAAMLAGLDARDRGQVDTPQDAFAEAEDILRAHGMDAMPTSSRVRRSSLGMTADSIKAAMYGPFACQGPQP